MTALPPLDAQQHARSGVRRIIANTAWLLAGKGVGGVLSLFYLAIVTRTLGVAGFGQFSLIIGTAQTIALIVSFQTWQVVVRYAADLIGRAEEQPRYARLIGLCTGFDIFGALLGCALAWAATDALAPWFGWDRGMTGTALAFACVMLLSVRSTPMGLLRIENRFDLGTYAEAAIPLMRMAGALFVWLNGPSITGFLVAWALAEVACALTYWILAARQAPQVMALSDWRQSMQAWRSHPGIGGYLLITNAGSTVTGLAQNIGVLVVGLFVGPVAAGLFRIASQLSGAMTKISTLLSRAIFAEVNRVRSAAGGEGVRHLYGRTNRLLYLTGAVILALTALLGKPVLLLMSGADYAPAYPLMVLLALAAVINMIGAMNEPTLMSGDGAWTAFWLQALATLFYGGVMVIALPRYGVYGAAGAMVAYALVRQILLRAATGRHLDRAE